MMQLKTIYGIGAAILLTTAANVYAEEGDMAQTLSQERSRTQLNLHIPMADFAQSQNREEHTVKNQYQNQNQYQYKYMNKHQNKESNSGASSSLNRMNTTNRYMQGSSATGSMNRTNTASRSMSGGRR
ncbi:hypothetical protein N9112_02810 [bacterium]|nr:hypothetical protein [bacterium]